MFNISLDIDYINIYRRNENLPLSDEEDIIITKGLERACNFLSDFNFKATFFVIGDSIRQYRRHYLKLIEHKHEIANHTMSHPNLLELSLDDQRRQIYECQKIIKEELGCDAAGFKAPGYGVSEQIYKILSQCGIRYDTSSFNNILVPMAKIIYYLRSGKDGFGKVSHIFGERKIHKKGDLFIIPVGTTIFKLPFYGSFHAMYPFFHNLNPPKFAFTYLIHPIEFLENSEMVGLKTGFKTSLSERMNMYYKIFRKLKQSKRRCVLLKNIIEELR